MYICSCGRYCFGICSVVASLAKAAAISQLIICLLGHVTNNFVLFTTAPPMFLQLIVLPHHSIEGSLNVSQCLLQANSSLSHVGVGTCSPEASLQVLGGILAQPGIPSNEDSDDVGYRFNTGTSSKSTGIFASIPSASASPSVRNLAALALKSSNQTIPVSPGTSMISLWIDGDSMLTMSKANSQSSQDYFTLVTGSLHITGFQLSLGRPTAGVVT